MEEELETDSFDSPRADLLLPLSRVTLAARSGRAYEWINRSVFTTGLLVANIQEKLILEKDTYFPVPSSLEVFENDEGFSVHLFRDLFVIECDPVLKGVLSLHTEIVVVEQYSEVDCDDDITSIKQRLRDDWQASSCVGGTCGNLRGDALFLSDFATPLASVRQRSNAGYVLELTAAVDGRSKTSKKVQLVIVTDYVRFSKCCHKSESPSCDIFNSILVTKSNAKILSLFDGDFVSVGVGEKNTKQRAVVLQAIVTTEEPFQTEQSDICSIFALPTVRFALRLPSRDSRVHVTLQRYRSPEATTGSSCSPSWSDVPPHASQMQIACVHSATYSSQLAYAELLQNYFTTQRLVTRGGIICVPTSDDAGFWQPALENGDTRRPVLYFKVLQISPKSRTAQTYLVDCQHTTVLLDPPVHSYVPSSMTSVVTSQRSVTPPGLESYVTTIVDWFLPYVTHTGKKREGGMLPSVLVSGSPGCGKSGLTQAVATSLNVHYLQVNCHELCGETPAATEARLRLAVQRAHTAAPCVVCFRNADVLGRDREGVGEDLRVAGSFSSIINAALSSNHRYPIVVIATTSSLRTMSRDMQQAFLYSVAVEAPSEAVREQMLGSVLGSAALHRDVSLKHVAQRTAGMNLGDIKCLVARVRKTAYDRIQKYWRTTSGRDHMTGGDEEAIAASGVLLKAGDFESALKELQKAHSSSIGAPQIPNVSWDDVGGLKSVKREILDTIQLPLEHPQLFASGLRRSGVLFYGPPGTGKTLLAKAVATECSLNFLSVKGPELINMYVGQSEENVRHVFERARSASPCVIFFDELDSLAPNRGRSGDSGGVMDRVVSQLLAELDGISKSSDVFVIGATNRPDLLDPALLRPGRFDKLLYLGVSQDKESQLLILKALTRKFKFHKDCDLGEIVEKCPLHMTGADFYALCSDAMLNALKAKVDLLQNGEEVDQSCVEVTREDYERALRSLVPSISLQELARYEVLQRQLDSGQYK